MEGNKTGRNGHWDREWYMMGMGWKGMSEYAI